MSIITVEAERRIPPDALKELKALDPQTRGVPIRLAMDGQRLVCGRITIGPVAKILAEARVPFTATVWSRHGSCHTLDTSRYEDAIGKGEIPQAETIFQRPPILPEQPITLSQPLLREQYFIDQERLGYLERLGTLPKPRATALEVALGCICEGVNSAGRYPTVYPWMLVEFSDFPQPSSKISLAKINRCEPLVGKIMWDFIHGFEQNDGSEPAVLRLRQNEDDLLVMAEIISTDVVLNDGFRALARGYISNYF